MNAPGNLEVLGLPAQEFFSKYWQKGPAWGRQSLAFPKLNLTTDTLLALCAEDEVESRLIIGPDDEGRWAVRHGPLSEREISGLPKKGWTLLVQDLDKWLPELGSLWAQFEAIPRWRRDDIMISWAVPGGSVGPHVDRYDVFLAQLAGRRSWTTGRPGTPIDPRLTDGLKLCSIERAERHAVAEPGDVLYLPPGHAHHGIAVNECLTLSFGMRAPSLGEVLLEFAQDQASREEAEQMYRDPDLQSDEGGRWLTRETSQRLYSMLSQAMALDQEGFDRWAARLLTSFSARRDIPVPCQLQTEGTIRQALRSGRRAQFSPWSRQLGIPGQLQPVVAIDGESYDASADLVEALLEDAPFKWHPKYQESDLELLVALFESGQMIWFEDE